MAAFEGLTPNVDDLKFGDLYSKEEYSVETSDGWRLIVTRYKPVQQVFKQPLFGQPILMVHGFTQNRHTWSAGEFVKNLLFFGVDVHILELRGHGRSSVKLQQDLHRKEGRPLPADINYEWNLDSYFLYDIPAAIDNVKAKSGHSKIFYCGHSMGGMLAYGYAGLHDDLLGLITIGSPSNLGKDFWPVRLVAQIERGRPLLQANIKLANIVRRGVREAKVRFGVRDSDGKLPAPVIDWEFRYLPFDYLLRSWGKLFKPANALSGLTKLFPLLYNPKRVVPENILWLLTWGGEKEPLSVATQFAKWIRNDEMKCYETNYNFRANFSRINIPIAIIFGDEDRLASINSTRSIYRGVTSEYLLWRPVRGNSHMELTMGHDIRQICYDIKNLMEYALNHEHRRPSLPRKDADTVRTDASSRRARLLRIVK